MLLNISILLAVIALAALVIRPATGILLLLLFKPVIDTAFGTMLVPSLNLSITRTVSVLVPILIFLAMLRTTPEQSVRRMPLKGIWIVYALNILFFSSVILVNKGITEGLEVFFRHINGFVGFFMMQAFFHDREGVRKILLMYAIGGLFPIGVGIYQILTGAVWIEREVEGLSRAVGLYYDVFTVRYYACQTILALVLYSALFLRERVVMKAALLLYGVMAAAVVAKAYTKSGTLTLATWAIYWTGLQKKFLILAVGVGCVIVLLPLFAGDLVDNLILVFRKEAGALGGEIELENTLEGRWYGWQSLVAYWSGLGVMAQLFGSGRSMIGAHNDYLQILFHGGVIGLGIYITLLVTIGIRILRNLVEKVDPLGVAALMLFSMYLMDTIGLVPSSYPGYQWLVWGLVGVSFRMREDERKQSHAAGVAEKNMRHILLPRKKGHGQTTGT